MAKTKLLEGTPSHPGFWFRVRYLAFICQICWELEKWVLNLNVQIWRGEIQESEHLKAKQDIEMKCDIDLGDGDFNPYFQHAVSLPWTA